MQKKHSRKRLGTIMVIAMHLFTGNFTAWQQGLGLVTSRALCNKLIIIIFLILTYLVTLSQN